MNLRDFQWTKHPANPVLPPVADSAYDCGCCMNPFAVRIGDEYRLYYAGADKDGHRRICLATAPVSDVTNWTRHGVILDLGPEGSFCAEWCVLPLVHRIGDTWHLYWSGRSDHGPGGLQNFPGIGLATGSDGVHFEKYSDDPVITGDRVPEFPHNHGIAGGGTILEDRLPDGSVRYRMYYTLATGVVNNEPDPLKNMCINQEKHCAVCFSTDGVHWTDHRIVMSPRPDVPHEDAASAAPFVWRDGDDYRMIYSAIGTRWGYYCLAQAVSEDGFTWERGHGDRNLVMQPDVHHEASWERQMVEYPSLVREGDRWRLFYCGNGYGATGIGTATAPA